MELTQPTQMTLIEMVSYSAAHITSDQPWRCMKCERLTPHADDAIIAHLTGAHGMAAGKLDKEHDTIFLLVTPSPAMLVGNA